MKMRGLGQIHRCSILGLIILCLAFNIVGAVQFSLVAQDDEWNQLSSEVEANRQALIGLMNQAETQGICTGYASVSELVIRLFQTYAAYDYANQSVLDANFQTFSYYGKLQGNEAAVLPKNELRSCLNVASNAIQELQSQLANSVTLSEPPDLPVSVPVLDSPYYRSNGQVVFPSQIVWMPDDEELMQAFGRMGGLNYALQRLNTSETVKPYFLNTSIAAAAAMKESAIAPQVFLVSHAPEAWMTAAYPEITIGARNFTKYDIDNQHVRSWLTSLFEGFLPSVCTSAGQPLVHLLANEPHFATVEGGWLSSALSESSMQKYRDWVAAKYVTVDAVNAAYGSSFVDLDAVDLTIPIDSALRGGPVWYDWCRFNMDRVNNWFEFLKAGVQSNDPYASPTTIKIIGSTLSGSDRDHGLDMEYLTKLQDISGGDLKATPEGTTFYRNDAETNWLSRYSFDWVGQLMDLDFAKSLRPDHLFYDSEWHGFSTVSWRHFNMPRSYVRAAIWSAFVNGMGAIEPWYWGRESDGAPDPASDLVGQLLTQPEALDAFGRTMKELNAHADAVASLVPTNRRFMLFYCEESAIQSETYIGQLKTVYEALKLLNVPMGFTTPSELGGLNPTAQTLIVPPTPFVKDSDLEQVRAFGGNTVMIGESLSFLKDELGEDRADGSVSNLFVSVATNDVLTLAADLDVVLSPIKPATVLDVSTDGYGVLINQSENDDGSVTFSLINVGNEERSMRIDSGSPIITDLITRQTVSFPLTLQPQDVQLLRAEFSNQ